MYSHEDDTQAHALAVTTPSQQLKWGRCRAPAKWSEITCACEQCGGANGFPLSRQRQHYLKAERGTHLLASLEAPATGAQPCRFSKSCKPSNQNSGVRHAEARGAKRKKLLHAVPGLAKLRRTRKARRKSDHTQKLWARPVPLCNWGGSRFTYHASTDCSIAGNCANKKHGNRTHWVREWSDSGSHAASPPLSSITFEDHAD
eukprot:2339165-Pleurochrysis_carterae.AAC.2